MNILYIGSGFVGTCSAAVMADSGHSVLVYDVNKEKIAKLSSRETATNESCLFEAGLAELLIANHDHIQFTDDYARVTTFLDTVELIFMCLPTPEKTGAEGESDLTYYDTAARTARCWRTRSASGRSWCATTSACRN
jgi:UDPglucose 6-dehydrogenase